MTKITAAITAVGGYVPEFVLTNKMLEEIVDTNDEWIVSRTGIKERRILKGEGLGSSDMGKEAVLELCCKPFHYGIGLQHFLHLGRNGFKLCKQLLEARLRNRASLLRQLHSHQWMGLGSYFPQLASSL